MSDATLSKKDTSILKVKWITLNGKSECEVISSTFFATGAIKTACIFIENAEVGKTYEIKRELIKCDGGWKWEPISTTLLP